MANILELASQLAEIAPESQVQSSEHNDYFPSNCKELCSSYFADIQQPVLSASPYHLDPPQINWDTPVQTVTQGLDDDKTAAQQTYTSTSEHNQEENFDFFIKGFADSPVSSPNSESGFSQFLEELNRNQDSSSEVTDSNGLSRSNATFTTLSNDSGVSDESNNYPSSCNLSTVTDNSSYVVSDELNSSNNNKCVSATEINNNNSTEVSPSIQECKRPDISYVEMIGKCILASKNGKVALSEIYDFILKEYPYFENAPPAWRISVRHHLSTCESFIKVGRVPLSRGFYWAVHPTCKEDFKQGIFDRKLMRKRIGNLKPRKRTSKKTVKENINLKRKVGSSDNCSKTSNDVVIVPTTIDSPYVPTTIPSVQYNQIAQQQQRNTTDLNKQAIVPGSATYNQVYNRLSNLTEQAPKYSTPVRGYYNQHSYQYSTPTNYLENAIQSNNVSVMQNNGYYNGYSSPTSTYHGYYNNGYTNDYSYGNYSYFTGQSYSDSISSPYGQSQMAGKMSQCNNTRYSPY